MEQWNHHERAIQRSCVRLLAVCRPLLLDGVQGAGAVSDRAVIRLPREKAVDGLFTWRGVYQNKENMLVRKSRKKGKNWVIRLGLIRMDVRERHCEKADKLQMHKQPVYGCQTHHEFSHCKVRDTRRCVYSQSCSTKSIHDWHAVSHLCAMTNKIQRNERGWMDRCIISCSIL